MIHSNYLRARQTWQAIPPELPEALKVEESGEITPMAIRPSWRLPHRAGGGARQHSHGQPPASGGVPGAEPLSSCGRPHACHLRPGLHRVARWQRGLALAGRTAYNTVKVNKKLQIGFWGRDRRFFRFLYKFNGIISQKLLSYGYNCKRLQTMSIQEVPATDGGGNMSKPSSRGVFISTAGRFDFQSVC